MTIKTQKGVIDLFENHKRTIYKVAWKFYKKCGNITGLHIDEFISEGRSIFFRIIEKYDPNKEASFNTFLTRWLNTELMVFMDKFLRLGSPVNELYGVPNKRKFVPQDLSEVIVSDDSHEDRYNRSIDFDLAIKGLSDKSKLMIKAILSGDENLFNSRDTITKERIKNKIKKEYGWNERDINSCIEEIHQMLKDL